MSGFSARLTAPIVGLVIGLALGLLYTWVIDPVELVNTYPALLRTDYRRDWVRLAALSYVTDGNLGQARARLDGIQQEDVTDAIETLIEKSAAAGRPAETLRSLTTLAQALNVHTPAMLVYLHTPASSPPAPVHTPTLPHRYTPIPSPTPTLPHTPTRTPTPTPTPRPPPPLLTPTSRPTNTPSPPTPTPPLLSRLELAKQEQICEPGQAPRIEVVVRDERGAGVSGVEIWLMWPSGADRAVTGLKPYDGAGYADFYAEWGVSYSIGIGELGMSLVNGLRLKPCPTEAGEGPLIGSWHIVLAP